MKLRFSPEEKKNIKEALDNILDDLDELWKKSPLEEIYCFFSPIRNDSAWSFIIDKHGIRISTNFQKIILENFKNIYRRPRIKDYTEIYYFLRQYENIRPQIEEKIISSTEKKGKGIDEILAIRDKYAKEATIEVELPEGMNQHSIELRQEDGKSIGEIKMGHGTIKIITKGPISVIRQEEQAKIKKK